MITTANVAPRAVCASGAVPSIKSCAHHRHAAPRRWDYPGIANEDTAAGCDEAPAARPYLVLTDERVGPRVKRTTPKVVARAQRHQLYPRVPANFGEKDCTDAEICFDQPPCGEQGKIVGRLDPSSAL